MRNISNLRTACSDLEIECHVMYIDNDIGEPNVKENFRHIGLIILYGVVIYMKLVDR